MALKVTLTATRNNVFLSASKPVVLISPAVPGIKGDQGNPGMQGDPGPVGPPGADADFTSLFQDITADDLGAVTAQPAIISGKAVKETIADTDILLIADSEDNWALKQISKSLLNGGSGGGGGLWVPITEYDLSTIGGSSIFMPIDETYHLYRFDFFGIRCTNDQYLYFHVATDSLCNSRFSMVAHCERRESGSTVNTLIYLGGSEVYLSGLKKVGGYSAKQGAVGHLIVGNRPMTTAYQGKNVLEWNLSFNGPDYSPSYNVRGFGMMRPTTTSAIMTRLFSGGTFASGTIKVSGMVKG